MRIFNNNLKIIVIIIGLMIIAAVLIRLFALTGPPFNAHTFRQTQNLATIQDYYQNGINLFYPKTNYVGYPGLCVVEFPVFQAGMALLWQIFSPVIVTIRLYNILIGLLTALVVYLIARQLFGDPIALFSAFVYLFIPLNIVYQRSIMYDPTAVFFATLAVYLFLLLRQFEGHHYWLIYFSFFATIVIASLIKPVCLFPLVVIYFVRLIPFYWKKVLPEAFIFLVALSLLFLWIRHGQIINSASPFTSHLSVVAHIGFNKIFSPYYWITLVYRFATKFSVGPALFLLFLSLLLPFLRTLRDRKLKVWLGVLWFIIIGYLVVFANVNAPHDYYQLILMPYLAILISLAGYYLYYLLPDNFLRRFVLVAFIITYICSASVSALKMMENSRSIPLFASQVSQHLDQSVKYVVIFGPTPGANDLDRQMGDPAYLYAIGKHGLGFSVSNMDEALQVLAEQSPYLNNKFGEIIFYRLGVMDAGQVVGLRKIGFREKMRGPDFFIFRLIK